MKKRDETNYKEKVETLYSVSTNIFDKVVYNSSQECFIYVPTSSDNALAKFLLHTLGYDLNGKDAFANNVSEIAFLVEGDIIYCDINLNENYAYGQIKFQFDQLNSTNMPEYIKPTTGEGAEHAGKYVGKGTINTAQEQYTTVASELTLNADLTGIFTFGDSTYNLTWSAFDDPTNQNKIIFSFVITSETNKGETLKSAQTNPTTATVGADMPAVSKPTRTGYTFTGWFTAASGGIKVFD